MRDCFQFNVIHQNSQPFIEQLWFNISVSNRTYTICVVYRPGNNFTQFLQSFEDTLSTFFLTCDDFIRLGDFNCNALDITNNNYKLFTNILESFN